ncbi:MAG: O-antigen/teichoic acid export membrane protein [Patiriisocius sp.]
MNNSKTNNTVQAFWVAMGSMSSIALSIVSAAILSRYFNKADYGTYKQIVYVYSTLLVVFSAGLPRVFSYFLPRFSLEEGKTIVKKVNRVLFLAGLFFSLFLFSFSGIIASVLKNPDLAYGLKVFSPIPMLLLPTLGIEGIFSTYKKTMFIAIYNTLSRVLMLIFIVVPVIIFKGDYISAIYGWLVVSILTFIMAYFFKGIPFINIESKETTLNYKEIFAYSTPLVIASIWGITIKSADQFYISRYFGKEVFAEFSNGFIELPFVTMITASTSVVLMPMFSKVFHENKGIDGLIKTWRSSLNKSSKVIFPIVIFFMVFASEIMVVLYSEQYKQSSVYFRINMFLNFFNIIIFAPLFLAMGKTKLYAKVHMVLAIIIWITGYILVKYIDSPIAIAVNSTTLQIFKIIFFIFLSSKILKIKFIDFFPFKSFALILLQGVLMISIVMVVQIYLLSNTPLILQLIICSFLYGALMLVTGKFFKIDYLSVVQPLLQRIKK